MLNGTNNIDNLFKSQLKSFEQSPPDYIWNEIETSLHDNKKTKRHIILWRTSAAASIAAIILFSILYFMPTSIKPQFAETNPIKETIPTTKNKKVKNAKSLNHIPLKSHTSNQQESDSHPTITPNRSISTAIRPNNQNDSKKNQNLVFLATKKNIIHESFEVDHLKLKQKENHSIPNNQQLYACTYPSFNSTSKKTGKDRKIIIGGSISPSYNYRELGKQQTMAVKMDNTSSETQENGFLSISGGINMRVRGKSKWSIETGILYTQVGQEVTQSNSQPMYYNSYAPANMVSKNTLAINNSLGTIKVKSKSETKLKQPPLSDNSFNNTLSYSKTTNSPTTIRQSLDFIEVPLLIRYSILQGTPTITISGGLSSNFLIDNNAYLIQDDSKTNIGSTADIKNINYSSTFGLGLEIPINKLISFSLEPTFKYFLTPINKTGSNDFRPYSFGIFGGINFSIR
ncbi:hypothetical protein DMA11_01165 [Marinilabiliaceae bacterium JC017]|nr:hypothetical protein DMA11_01165 [Marinilabiliaceae bacterium JC017]